MDAQSLGALLGTYQRDSRLTEVVLQHALEDADHGTAFREWLHLHAGRDNLLTKDELALYSSLDEIGLVDKLAESNDLALVQAVTEPELTAAIKELEKSTAEITKQTEILQQHQNALDKLAGGVKKAAQTRSDLEAQRSVRQASLRKQTLAKVEELSHSLGFRTTDLEQQAHAAKGNLSQVVNDLLQSDDKLLSSLQKLGHELEAEDPEEKQNVANLRETCLRLIKFTVETIRTKLDRVYLEALMSAQRDDYAGQVPAEEVKALQEEVESLYAETLPVAQMSVEQVYLEPALKSVSERNGNSLGRSAVAVVYVNECLDYLLDHLTSLSSHAENVNAHQIATAGLVEATRAELALPIVSPGARQGPPQPMSPVRPRSTAHATISTPAPGHRRRRSSSGLPEDGPLEALLRLLAVPVDSTESPNGPGMVAALARSQADREVKSRDIASGAQESFERATAAHLIDARRAMQLLHDSILAESPFGSEVKLLDPEIEGSIIVLGQEVAKVKERVEEAEEIVAKKKTRKHGGSEKQREMIERWA